MAEYDSVVGQDRDEARAAARWPLYHDDMPDDDRPDARELAERTDELRALRRKGLA